MINLVPTNARKIVVTEYWIRVVSVWLFIVSVVSLMIMLLISPVYVLVTTSAKAYALTASEAAEKVAEYDLSVGALIKANVLAQKTFDLREVERFSSVISSLELLHGKDISIESFEFGRKDMTLAPVQVTGRATTRQALANFRDVLLSQSNVTDVFLPISNLAKDKDIQFSISIVFKPEEIK